MENLYIDESGSMTCQYCDENPYFIIAIIRALNNDRLKRMYKRFVSSKIDRLRELDKNGKMFKNGRFYELKGSQFDPPLKREFVDFFCKNNYFELFYIEIDNRKINKNLFNNTARAFNYVLRLAFEYYLRYNYLPDSQYVIQLDERNERTETKYFLENYLNTELIGNNALTNNISVKYFDSRDNKLIQLADVFANIYFSQCITGNYTDQIDKMKRDGYLKNIFKFPYYKNIDNINSIC